MTPLPQLAQLGVIFRDRLNLLSKRIAYGAGVGDIKSDGKALVGHSRHETHTILHTARSSCSRHLHTAEQLAALPCCLLQTCCMPAVQSLAACSRA